MLRFSERNLVPNALRVQLGASWAGSEPGSERAVYDSWLAREQRNDRRRSERRADISERNDEQLALLIAMSDGKVYGPFTDDG